MAWIKSIQIDHSLNDIARASADVELTIDEAMRLRGAQEIVITKKQRLKEGDSLKCLEAEGAYSLQKNLVYTFDRLYNGKENRVVLKEFPKTSFDASRFEQVAGLVTYGDPGKGKTILGKASGSMKLEGTFSNGILSDMADAMGMSVSSRPKAYAIEDKASDHLYVHGNTTKPVGLPVRRQRQGRKLVP